VLFLSELARGSMGELIGVVGTREVAIAGNAQTQERIHLMFSGNFTYLYSFNSDNHKYVQADAFGYDKCIFSCNLEAKVPIKIASEEKNA
jgi:hypothetical protein